MSNASRVFLVGLGLLIVSIIFAQLAYAGLEGWTWIDVVYMIVITVFGVGYGEVHPIESPELKLWTIGIIITGCTSLILLTAGFVQFLLESQIRRAFQQNKMERDIRNLKNHIIIVGFGRVGRLLTQQLRRSGRDLIILDRSQEVLDSREDSAIPVLAGDATDEEVLIQAGIMNAKTIAIVLPDDAANVFITLSARNLQPNLEIIARGAEPSTEKKLIQAGANQVVLLANSGAEQIAQILRPVAAEFIDQSCRSPHTVKEDLNELGLGIDELSVTKNSPLAGITIQEAEELNETKFLVVGVHRGSEVIRKPESSFTIQPDDGLLVVGHQESLSS